MRKRIIVVMISLFMLLTLLAACQDGSKEASKEEQESSAEETAELFLTNLSEEKYEEAYEQLDEDMEDAIGVEDLEDVWTMVGKSSGEHIEFEYERTDSDEAYEIVYIKSIFTKEDITFMITVNEEQEVAGFFVV